jgi:hypothetical protein
MRSTEPEFTEMVDLEENISTISSERPLNQQRPLRCRGGIKLCGCVLRLASDDFVLPAWIAFLSRLLFLTATIAIMAYSMQIVKMGPSCLNVHSLDIYMPLVTSLMTANCIMYILLAYHSSKGVIWDENPKSRR